MTVRYAQVRRFALSLPGVGEEPHFGMPSFRVNKRMLVTVPSEAALHVFVSDAERDTLLDVYATCTDKVYWGGKVVGIRLFLDKATRGAAEDLILRAWKHRAPKKDIAAYEARAAADTREHKAPRKAAARGTGGGKRGNAPGRP